LKNTYKQIHLNLLITNPFEFEFIYHIRLSRFFGKIIFILECEEKIQGICYSGSPTSLPNNSKISQPTIFDSPQNQTVRVRGCLEMERTRNQVN
jgi:hypothetical protein